jgi:ADP-heptose:LPS heptosyltransferase
MNTLVVNLTRFGDLLQTQPVLAGLQERGGAVGLVCLENFAPAAGLLHGPDAVFAFPGAGLLADLDRAWPTALGRLQVWRDQVCKSRDYTTVLNLTPTQGARLLARVISSALEASHSAGFGLDDQGFASYGNAWAAFLQMSSMHRGCSPFNLVDVMLRCAGLPVSGRPLTLNPPPGAALQDALDLLQAKAPSGCAGYVAFQLGASEVRRQWPEAYFARLGQILWEKFGLCPVLLGAQAERGLAESYANQATVPHIDLVGRTSLLQLAGVLCHCRLLVTNDTGTMHLAAGLNRPVVAIFLATAQPWDTGPYREGCLCLEPDLECHPCSFGQPCLHQEACRRTIQAEEVFDSLTRHLIPEAFAVPEAMSCTAGARIWLTCRDEQKFLDLKALSGQDSSIRTQWIRIQRHYYRQFLDQAPEIIAPGPIFHPVFHLPETVSRGLATSLEQSQALLHLLGSQADVLNNAPLDKVKQKFLAYWERLQIHWRDDPFFSVLGRLWLVESQECAQNLADIQALTRRYARLISAWRAMFGA